MADAGNQKSFVEHNGDQVHDALQYQIQEQALNQAEYQAHDQSQQPLLYQEYQAEDQVQQEVQDEPQEQLLYQPQDQEQYQVQEQEEDPVEYQVEDQAEEQEQEYQVDDQENDQAQEHVLDQEQNQDEMPDNIEPEQKAEDVSGAGGEKKWPGWPGESVFRMLVPAQKVGSIIGRKGDVIKKIVEESRARIKILDGPPGTAERAVMISGKEEPDSVVPPAIDGLLRVHKRIVDGLEGDASHMPPGGKVSTRLLVPASQAGSLIGKQGGTVKTIQEASNCIVRVLGSEDLPVFALQDDRVVEVVGDPSGVHKALELITSHLRKFLVDRSIIPLFESQMQKPTRQMDHMPPHQPWGPPQGLPPSAGGGPGFGHNPPPYMPPPRHVENYYPPAEMHPQMEKQPHQGISAYGREPPMRVHAPSNAPGAPSMIAQVTQQMQIPLSYADAVIGTSGSSISYIRRASGATVTIQETRGVPGEMTVEISGTASQVQTAQQLIQNFMAEAGATVPTTVGSTDQGYNPYAAHSSVYASPPSNPGHAAHPGSYGADYSNYGY